MSQNVVVFFNKDVIIIKPLMIAVLSLLGGAGGGGGLHDCLRLPRLLAANTRQLEILVTTLSLNRLIIHSKYFSVSDWLKALAQFTITTTVDQIWENFAINQPMMSKVQHRSRLMHR